MTLAYTKEFFGSWKQVHDRLVQWMRAIENRVPTPSAASLAPQTLPTSVLNLAALAAS